MTMGAVSADDLPLVTDPISVKEIKIHLPTVPVVVEPNIPNVDPPVISEISTISKGQLYIVESSVALISLQSPEDFLNIITVKGPISVYGLFVDGGVNPELRTYKSENILIVTGIKSGKTELILIPVGVTEKSEIVTQILTISGEGPRPPPTPIPPTPIPPTPDPTPTPVTSFRVIFVKESGATLSAEQSAIPGAKEIRDYLTAKTTKEGGVSGVREYDPDQNTENEQPIMRALWEQTKPKLKPAPCLVIEVNGVSTVMDFPINVAAALETLKQYGGK